MKKVYVKKFRGFSSTVVLLVALLILGGIAGLYVINNSAKRDINISPKELVGAVMVSPSPSPFPFQEMTVPYLRNRGYESKLGELEKYADNGSFSSYLTSFSSDGLKINGLLTQPHGVQPSGGWPAIVFVHGYIPPSTYRTTEKYGDYVNFLARNGFVVFKIDLRGHGDSEGEPGGGYYSSDYVIDVLSAYSALQNSGFVNPQKIGIWGHSMAGNVVLRSVAAKPDIPVVVIWAGAGFTYSDLVQYRIMDLSYRPQPSDSERQRKRQQLRELYGDPDPNNWFWKLVIPTNYLNDFKGAIQLDHAVDDQTVNVDYSRNLNRILNETTIPHEYNEFPNGDHNITNPSFVPAMEKTVDFFEEYLKN